MVTILISFALRQARKSSPSGEYCPMFDFNPGILGSVLPTLLKDRAAGRNIIFACEGQYENADFCTELTPDCLEKIMPRWLKSREQRDKRQKKNAEVFTPAWLCNSMNNIVDSAWFGYENVFNTEKEKSWETKKEKIAFPDGKTWKDYVLARRMEITCGEAPYLTSRYDSVSGEIIDVGDRIGLFDRKLRIVSENISDEEEWLDYVQQALQSVYGFEYQGDNLLIARCNMLLALAEYFEKQFSKGINLKYLEQSAEIISWNLWQMDGLTYRTPDSEFISVGRNAMKISECRGTSCIIYNWQEDKQIVFADLAAEK